ncbi:uncharacterized protein LOC107304312 [Oryza brachyantha]|uniref:Uncharacterized protein n=1 Tax=Oryza brachyantha TaxID=4533 RepID=J3MA05_ORYBR|nr:uncharacterized protein LOC107304312 [Oryza brachyantha]
MDGGDQQIIVMKGLRNAVLRASEVVGPRVIAVGSVRVSDTAAMVALLEKEVLRQGWEIQHKHRLIRLSRLDHDLTIVLEVLVPILVANPLDLVAGRELRRYGRSMEHTACSVVGPSHPLYAAAGPVRRLLRQYAKHQYRGTKDDTWLAGNIWEVHDRVSAIRTFLVDFQHFRVPEDDDIGDDRMGDAAAEAKETIVIRGLRDAVLRAAEVISPRVIAVEYVRVRDTPAMVALFEKEVLRQHWRIKDKRRLIKLSRLDHDLTIVLEILVPMLVDNRFDLVAGRELRRYGWSIQHKARSVAGCSHPLYAAAGPVGRFLRRHAHHQHQATKGAVWLDDNIVEVRKKISALRSFLVRFPFSIGGE